MRGKLWSITVPNAGKAVLSVLEAKLTEALRSGAERERLEIEYLADPADQVSSGIDREMTVNRLNQKAQLMYELRAAIDRVHSGEFGICEQCEEAIGQQRLNAIPWARLCVRCQSQSEASGPEAVRFGHAA